MNYTLITDPTKAEGDISEAEELPIVDNNGKKLEAFVVKNYSLTPETWSAGFDGARYVGSQEAVILEVLDSASGDPVRITKYIVEAVRRALEMRDREFSEGEVEWFYKKTKPTVADRELSLCVFDDEFMAENSENSYDAPRL